MTALAGLKKITDGIHPLFHFSSRLSLGVEGLCPVFFKGFLVTRTLLDHINCLFVQRRIALVMTIIYISRIIATDMRFGYETMQYMRCEKF